MSEASPEREGTPEQEKKLEEARKLKELLRDLRGRQERLRKRASRSRGAFYLTVGLGWVGTLAYYTYTVGLPNYRAATMLPPIGAAAAAAIWTAAYFRSQLTGFEADVQEIDFEIELQQFEVLSRERRAEKLIRINNRQLRRYHETNLSQNLWVFALGVGCILAGVGIVAAALHLVRIGENWESNVLVAALGAIGSIMVHYVAALFLRMHAGASENLTLFHDRLVETHQLLMGNLLASRIEDNDKRWETLSKLALEVSKRGT